MMMKTHLVKKKEKKSYVKKDLKNEEKIDKKIVPFKFRNTFQNPKGAVKN
jgi:hypothetical protein